MRCPSPYNLLLIARNKDLLSVIPTSCCRCQIMMPAAPFAFANSGVAGIAGAAIFPAATGYNLLFRKKRSGQRGTVIFLPLLSFSSL